MPGAGVRSVKVLVGKLSERVITVWEPPLWGSSGAVGCEGTWAKEVGMLREEVPSKLV